MKTGAAAAALALAFAVTATAGAQAIHKCTANGKVSYSDTPCSNGVATILNVPDAPAPAQGKAAQAALTRMERESRTLEKQRRQREAADDRAGERAGRANAARQQRCARLRLDRKWADEDLRGAQPQQAERARLKAQRAAEKVALLGCAA